MCLAPRGGRPVLSASPPGLWVEDALWARAHILPATQGSLFNPTGDAESVKEMFENSVYFAEKSVTLT